MKTTATVAWIISSTIMGLVFIATRNDSVRIMAIAAVIFLIMAIVVHAIEWSTMPVKRRTILKSDGRLSSCNFVPTAYYRLVKNRGWNNVVLEVDKEINKPYAEIVPVQMIEPLELGATTSSLCLWWTWPVNFEYEGQVFSGQMLK